MNFREEAKKARPPSDEEPWVVADDDGVRVTFTNEDAAWRYRSEYTDRLENPTVTYEPATDTMKTELRPCPFCGSVDIVAMLDGDDKVHRVICNGCGVTADRGDVDGGPIEAWNRRAALDSQAAQAQPRGKTVAWCRIEAWQSGKEYADDCFVSYFQPEDEGWLPLYAASPSPNDPPSEGVNAHTKPAVSMQVGGDVYSRLRQALEHCEQWLPADCAAAIEARETLDYVAGVKGDCNASD